MRVRLRATLAVVSVCLLVCSTGTLTFRLVAGARAAAGVMHLHPVSIKTIEPRAHDGTSLLPYRVVREDALRRTFPAQYRAQQTEGDQRTFHWALLIAIGTYARPTPPTVGSVPDASAFDAILIRNGWLHDHILRLYDSSATGSNIYAAFQWLAARTDPRSTAIVFYEGHEKPVRHRSSVALWSSDNRLITDADLGRALAPVRSARMWIYMGTCRAAGFHSGGITQPGRVITYSSKASELSNEDLVLKHSVFTFYMILRGMGLRLADLDHDGDVSVEEAYTYARDPVIASTGGRQHPMIVDLTYSGFSLRI